MQNLSGNRPMVNRPMNNNMERERQAFSGQTPNVAHRPEGKKPGKLVWWIVGIIAIVILAVIGWLLFINRSQVDGSKYQAVFLDNGQVYFGKLHGYYTANPYLTNVYYIQSQDTSTSGDKSSTATPASSTLIKLGSEIHGPEDKMILNKSSILFVENLTDKGKVVQAIKDGSAASGSNQNTDNSKK